MKKITISLQQEEMEVLDELGSYGYGANDICECLNNTHPDITISSLILQECNEDGSAYDFNKVVDMLVMMIEESTCEYA